MVTQICESVHTESSLQFGCPKYLKSLQKIFEASNRVKLFLKSCIQETKHLSTDADISTDAIGGWTKNTQKPDFFEKRKKSSKMEKLKNV